MKVCFHNSKLEWIVIKRGTERHQIVKSSLPTYEAYGWSESSERIQCDCVDCWKRKKLVKAARAQSRFGSSVRF